VYGIYVYDITLSGVAMGPMILVRMERVVFRSSMYIDHNPLKGIGFLNTQVSSNTLCDSVIQVSDMRCVTCYDA
jgi:hypothetical protein